LAKLYARYQPQGLIFYRIAGKENPDTVRQFLEKESLKFPVLLDPSGRVERLYGVWVHPTLYIINRQGLICYRVMGALDWTGVEATSIIDQLLQRGER
jgi:peroxiredoxin